MISQFDISKIKSSNIPVQNDKPDKLSSEEEENYVAEKYKLENKALEQNMDERKKYAKSIYFLIVGWLATLFLIIGFQGFGSYLSFNLSENIVLTLITGTTVNILGIFVIVVNYLFRR
jgi:hypothetical protein